MSGESRVREINPREYLLAGLMPLLGIFLLWGPRILNGENIYLGVIQEQYFLLGQYAFDHLIRGEFAAGNFPLWNPNNALGAPLLGNMLCAAFYPLKLLLYLWPSLLVYEFYVVLRFWLAGFFTYALGRRLGLSVGGSVFALCGFCFSGYFQLFLNENYLNADLLLPLLLLLGLETARSRSKKWPALLALVLFALFNSGHPEAIFYNWLFSVVCFAGFVSRFEKTAWREAAGRLVLANAFALLLSLPLILTFLEYWVRSYHFHLPGAGLYHYSVREFLAAFSPWFFGPGSPGAAFFHRPALGAEFSGLIPGYGESALPWLAPGLGILFLPLLALGVLELQRLPRIYLVWLGWVIFFLGVSFGLPFFRLLGLCWPFNFSGNFKHPWPALVLSASLTGALILERTLAGKIKARNFQLALLSALAVLLIFSPYSSFRQALNSNVLLELVFSALFLCWIWLARRGRWSMPIGLGLGVLVVMLSALLRVSWQEPVYPSYNLAFLRRNAIFQELKKDRLARFYFEREVFAPNLNQLLEVSELSVMDGLNHRRFVELVNFINGHSREQGFKYWYHQVGYLEVMPERIESAAVDLTGLKYIITRTPLPYSRSVERLLETGFVLARSAGHIGSAYFPYQGASAKTLFEHPPSRLAFDRCDLYRFSGRSPSACVPGASQEVLPSLSLTFAPRIQAEAVSREPDGVWFLVSHGSSLAYARYLHPARQSYEGTLARAGLEISGNSRIVSLITLPNNNSDYDWSGWVDLRVNETDTLARFKLLAADGFWFYENPEALPRFFMAEAGEWEKDNGRAKPAQLVFFKDRFHGSDNSAPGSGIAVKNFSSQSYEAEIELAEPGWLVVEQIAYPGWRAYLDGTEQRLVPASFLSALNVPAGKHHLKMIYRPWSFRVALYYSLISLLMLLVLVFLKRKTRREV